MAKRIGWHWGFLLLLVALLFGAVTLSGKSGVPENAQAPPSPVNTGFAANPTNAVDRQENGQSAPSPSKGEGTQSGVPSAGAGETVNFASPPVTNAGKSPEVPAARDGDKEAGTGKAASTTGEVPKGLSVMVAVVGQKGELLFGPASVVIAADNRWGGNALGALDATGLRYGMSPAYGSFVTSINGQANRGMRGWMYKVNDETPMVGANEKTVQKEDRVLWWYSNEMDAPSPDWEALAQQRQGGTP
ncbi:DUF4430 domain-containing protein [Heliobacterium gestii]|uniref:DUF4430 domain-containing protein n=1 Tax=Heliomicrobium gestii TaxID=2699 RepID=A0A845LFP2_HELGE|nr:DUF4430 domain-containing protein [Heliomicrobium gestii]MBM7868090.1 hypothetical protein [Heliomicrobium gestii]MZP44381.1 DUF4430 domain-containing protein [Heliomicrobium gestii]